MAGHEYKSALKTNPHQTLQVLPSKTAFFGQTCNPRWECLQEEQGTGNLINDVTAEF